MKTDTGLRVAWRTTAERWEPGLVEETDFLCNVIEFTREEAQLADQLNVLTCERSKECDTSDCTAVTGKQQGYCWTCWYDFHAKEEQKR